MSDVPIEPSVHDLLHDASNRLVRAVDAMSDQAWGRPSRLPGWTRSHVVAHLTRNAECLALALSALREGRSVPMYASQAARDRDIEELAEATPSTLRTRLLGATTDLREEIEDLGGHDEDARIERVPGGPSFASGGVAPMRLREVEIHLVDLDLGVEHGSWSSAFVRVLLDAMAQARTTTPGCRVCPTDLADTWTLGGGGATVSGTAADLGWWLTGRGAGEGLTCEAGSLPEIGAW